MKSKIPGVLGYCPPFLLYFPTTHSKFSGFQPWLSIRMICEAVKNNVREASIPRPFPLSLKLRMNLLGWPCHFYLEKSSQMIVRLN